MKKPNKTRKPPSGKARAAQRKKQAKSLGRSSTHVDDDMAAMVKKVALEGFEPSMFGTGVVGLFIECLDACAGNEADEEEKSELFSELGDALGELKVAANGGGREAREQIEAIHDLLDDAIEENELPPTDLMAIAKLFVEAGMTVPDNLKAAVAAGLRDAPADAEPLAQEDMVASLLELAELVGQNPYDIHEQLNSLVAALPAESSIALLSTLIAGGKAVIDQAAAGFLLHPDAEVARGVGEALAASAARTPVASAQIERLVRMRPWLPQARQAHLDATIRAMRLNALPPVKTELPKVIKCYASICDGSGTRSVIATQRVGSDYQIATVMTKPEGVIDAVVVGELSKRDMDDMVRDLKTSTLVMETDLPGVRRLLGLGLADNFASGKLPPFKLVEVVECLGLGPIPPEPASPLDLTAALLADLPADQTDATASARAHADVLGAEFEDQWFDVGEALEDMLYPVKGFKQRVAKLMKDYLPERRMFWARQCAYSALVLHGDEKARHPLWKQLALVGRDLASETPLDRIPLMKQVAELSVRAFESQV